MDEIRRPKGNRGELKAESLKFKAEVGGGPRRPSPTTASSPRSFQQSAPQVGDEKSASELRSLRSPSAPVRNDNQNPAPKTHLPKPSPQPPTPSPQNPFSSPDTVDILAPLLRVGVALRLAAARIASTPLHLWRWLPSRLAGLTARFFGPLSRRHPGLDPGSRIDQANVSQIRSRIESGMTNRRFRAAVGLVGILALSIGLFQILKSPEGVEASWWDESWSYRNGIVVDNTGAADANKKIKFDIDTATLITAGKLQSDCGDSRFTDNNGNLLRYYIDTAGGACNTASTDYYVLIPTIPAGKFVIYHYHGNAAAANGTEASQFSEATFTPNATTANSEETGAGPVAFWKFDEDQGPTAHDSMSTNHAHMPIVQRGSVLEAGDADDSDGFGTNTALSADGKVLAVGADSWAGAVASGGVYIFDWDGSAWSQRGAVLEAADAASADKFGEGIALSADGKIMAIGASNWEGATGSDRGGVYIYDSNGTSWTQRGAVIEAADAADSDWFGKEVALSDDGSILAVGAWGWEGAFGVGVGGVYIYDWDGVTWLQRGAVVEALDRGSGDSFGNGVALSADGKVLAVGAHYWDGDAGGNVGAAYIFDWNGAAWAQRGTPLQAADGLSSDLYGYSVALSADGSTLAVGAIGWEGAVGSARGGVYVYDWNGSVWVQRGAVLEAFDAADVDQFGINVAFSDDTSVLVVGADGWEGATGSNRGGVYTYDFTGPTWQTEDMCVSGKCLYFDGTDDELSVYSYTNAVQTVSFWVKLPSVSTTEQLLDLNGTDYITSVSGTVTANGFGTESIFVDGQLASTLSANTWHHVAVTTATELTATTITIGKVSTNFGQAYLDEVKLYPYARTAAQVKTDYLTGSSASGSNAVFGQKDTGYLNNGLVGYWKMDESSGDAIDGSGNSKTLTNNGTTTFASGKFGNSSGTFSDTKYFSRANDTDLNFTTQDFSISGWVNPSSFANQPVILGRGVYAYDGYYVQITTGGLLRFANGSSLQLIDSTSALSTSVWSFVTVVRKGANVNLYINGQNRTPSVNSISDITTSSRTLYVGRYEGATFALSGYLDELRIYNRALSEGEVRALYEYAPGPIAHFDFNEGSGTSVSNKGTVQINGTISGSYNYVPGKYGSALKFPGVGSKVTVPGFGNYAPTQEITVQFWAKADVVPADYNSMIWMGNDAPDRINIHFLQPGTAGSILWDFGSTSANRLAYAATSPLGAWHHWTFVSSKSGNYHRIYRDGVLDGSNSTSSTFARGNYPMYIANDYKGIIDEFKIYDYARTPAQIIEDMNAGHPAPGSPVGSAVSYWSFDEGALNTCSGGTNDYCDQSPAANDLAFSTTTGGYTTDGKQGFAWNGTNAVWASRADDADFDFGAAEPFSLAFWFRSDAAGNPGATQYLVNKASATAAGYAVYATTNGYICVGIDDDATWGPDVSSCTATDIYDATWHHVVATRDTVLDTTNIYVDGVLKDSDNDNTTATLENALAFYVGDRDGTDNGDEFAGDIDELKVYRLALNSDQVRVEYNAGKATVLGSSGTTSAGVADNSAAREYCVPGDTATCDPPVAEWKFDENTGTTANDSSGNNKSGTFINTPQWTIGKQGGAVGLNGTDQRIDTSLLIGPSQFSSLTLSTWVKVREANQSASYDEMILIADDGGWDRGISTVETTSGPGGLRIGVQNGNLGRWVTPGSFDLNSWTKVDLVYTPATISAYKNGVFIGSTNTGTIGSPSQGLQFGYGAGCGAPCGYAKVEFDTTRIYGYARTPAQIAWEYNQGAPVAWYRFDECQGATAYDASGNGLNGTITPGGSGNTSVGTCGSGVSTEMWNDGTTGKLSSSLGFDGTDDYVSCTDASCGGRSGLDGGGLGGFSVATWVKFNTTPNYTKIVTKIGDSGNYGYQLYLDPTDHFVWFASTTGSDAPNVQSNKVAQTGVWYHVVGVYDNAGAANKIYINGILDKSTANTVGTGIFDTTADFRIGNSAESSTVYLDGLVDDVRVYNYALNPTQVRDVYNNGAVSFQ